MDSPVNGVVKWVGRILSVAIVTSALALGLVVIHHADEYPRTDDSEILANFIGIAPQVEGPISPVKCPRQSTREARRFALRN